MKTIHMVQKGFTLIEIMIVVAIIGIIAAVAVPSYTNYVMKARATDAISTLADMRIRMEQYYQDNRTYVGGPCAAPAGANTTFFSFSCAGGDGTATTYTLNATGQGDMSAYTYGVDQNNAKSSAFNGSCWSTDKDNGHC